MFTPNGFVLEQARFHVCLRMPHNSLVLVHIKVLFFDYQFQHLKGFTALLNVLAAGPCNELLTRNKGSGEHNRLYM